MSNTIRSLADRLVAALPQDIQKMGTTVKDRLEDILRDALKKMDLVTREEFDAQAKALEQAQAKLAALTKQVDELIQQRK